MTQASSYQRHYQMHSDSFKQPRRLATIDCRPGPTSPIDTLAHSRRTRRHSFHQQMHQDVIQQQNSRLLQRLQTIARRTKSPFTQAPLPRKMTTYLNPARKKREKLITQLNMRLGERLIMKQSCLNRKYIKQNIDSYENLKESMSKNRKSLYSTLTKPSLPALSRKHPVSTYRHTPKTAFVDDTNSPEGRIKSQRRSVRSNFEY